MRGDRQPVGEVGRKGGSAADRAGYDAGKKVKGIKRHLCVDTEGLILAAYPTPACVQDRQAVGPLLAPIRKRFCFIRRIFADAGYSGEKTARAVRRIGHWVLEIVRRCDHAGFQVQAKRWIVERTFAWLSRQRRLAKDYEYTLTSAAAFIHLAFIRLILRRLTRGTP